MAKFQEPSRHCLDRSQGPRNADHLPVTLCQGHAANIPFQAVHSAWAFIPKLVFLGTKSIRVSAGSAHSDPIRGGSSDQTLEATVPKGFFTGSRWPFCGLERYLMVYPDGVALGLSSHNGDLRILKPCTSERGGTRLRNGGTMILAGKPRGRVPDKVNYFFFQFT
jgi:hypothetical protein